MAQGSGRSDGHVSATAGSVDALERSVRDDPVTAYRSALELLGGEPLSDDLRWRVQRAGGEAARWSASIETSIRLLQDAVETAQRTGSDEAVVACALTLAGSIAIGGDLPAAEHLLRDVEPIASPAQRDRVLFQLATVRARAGHHQDAIDLFDRILPRFEAAGDDMLTASLLGNLGMSLAESGELLRARKTLRSARRAYRELGLETNVAWVTHNLGHVEDLLGDVPRALRLYDQAAAALRLTTATPWEVEVSRCGTLIDAGLNDEACDLAVALADRLDEVGMSLDAAEARLAAARAMRALGRNRQALQFADQVVAEFEEQGRGPWSDLARLLRLEAQLEERGPAALDEVEDLAGRLHGRLARSKALLLLARYRPSASTPTIGHDDPLELQLLAAEVDALRLEQAGRHGDALVRLGAALRLAGRRRVVLGSAELRSAFGVHTARLAAIGRAIAERHRGAASELDWLERGRALSLLDAESTAALADPRLAELVGAHRLIGARLRTCAPADESALRGQQVALEVRIRNHQRTELGSHTSAPLPRHVARRTRHRLAGGLAMSLFEADGRLHALVVRKNRTVRVTLAAEADVRRATNRVRAALVAAALGRSTHGEAERAGEELDDLLFGQLELGGGDEQVAIAPPAWMFVVPWLALPSLASRAVTLSPSLAYASSGATAQGRAGDPGRRVAANGPGLEFGAAETRRIASHWTRMRRLTGREATPDAVVEAAGSVDCLHIAAHGHFNLANPLFSALELHGGSLSVNDVLRQRLAPSVVVLTACDGSLGRSHPGDELLGFPTAFLANGSDAVIAGVGLLPDTSTTVRTADALHEQLASGVQPAVALRSAVDHVAGDGRSDPFLARSTFVCIGRIPAP